MITGLKETTDFPNLKYQFVLELDVDADYIAQDMGEAFKRITWSLNGIKGLNITNAWVTVDPKGNNA